MSTDSSSQQPSSSRKKRKTSEKASKKASPPKKDENPSLKDLFSDEVKVEIGDILLCDDDDSRTFTISKHLSSGRYGKVFRVLQKNEPSAEPFACKIQASRFGKESSIHRRLSHKHIVKFVNSFYSNLYCFIFMEYCKNGTLRSLVRARESLTVFESRYFFHQIMLGIKYLHKMELIHRDLKLDNILLAKNMQIKIGDFGLAKSVNAAQKKRTKSDQNRNHYKAPELFSSGLYSTASDIWATGVILYKMVFAHGPFQMDDDFMAATKYKFDFPLESNDDLHDVLKDIFQPIELRCDAKHCLNSDFLSGHKIPKKLPESIQTEPMHESISDPSYES